MRNGELWRNLQAFEFDDPDSALPFSKRLAADNGWTHAFALRVLDEYRRFLYLGQCAGHSVTPSDEVDQAWHLHMVYTRSYWDDLCGDVLGKPFHHGPTLGGSDESSKYRDAYERTLESYRSEFGEPPPSDIWPATSERFGSHHQRIDRRKHVVLSKQKLARTAWISLAGTGVLGLVSCSGELRDRPLELFIGLGVILVISFILIVKILGSGGRGGGGSSGGCGGGWFGGGCSSDSGCGGGCGGD